MEVRRVQQVGRSTFLISLPKDWVEESGLKRGNLVVITTEEDGSIRVIPSGSGGGGKPREWVIDADSCDQKDLIARLLVGWYIAGHESVCIKSRRELAAEHLREVRGSTQRLSGLGIVEQTFSRMSLHTFVDVGKFSFHALLRRLHAIIMSLNESVIEALSKWRPSLVNEVLGREEEVDRLCLLLMRQLMTAVRTKTIRQAIGIPTCFRIFMGFSIVKAMEEMSDYYVRIVEEVQWMMSRSVTPSRKVLMEISRLCQSVQQNSDLAITALFNDDLKLANKVIENLDHMVKEKELIESLSTKVKDVGTAIGLRSIVQNLGLVARCCRAIAEATIDSISEGLCETNYSKVPNGILRPV